MVASSHLEAFLKHHKVIGLDSNILVYLIENSTKYHQLAYQIFSSIEKGRNIAVLSPLSFHEVLVRPYRDNNQEIVNRFYSLLSTFPNLHWLDYSVVVADQSAWLRSQYAVKTSDAIILATALVGGATGFIGNDRQFRKIKELNVMSLDEPSSIRPGKANGYF